MESVLWGDARLPEKFWKAVQIEEDSGCWLWTKGTTAAGYGNIRIDRVQWAAHRLFYSRLVGDIASGMQVDHLCRTIRCVNPAHMELVTRGENIKRGWAAKKAGLERTTRQRKTSREQVKRHFARLRAQGICTRCRVAPLATTWSCRECADKKLRARKQAVQLPAAA